MIDAMSSICSSIKKSYCIKYHSEQHLLDFCQVVSTFHQGKLVLKLVFVHLLGLFCCKFCLTRCFFFEWRKFTIVYHFECLFLLRWYSYGFQSSPSQATWPPHIGLVKLFLTDSFCFNPFQLNLVFWVFNIFLAFKPAILNVLFEGVTIIWLRLGPFAFPCGRIFKSYSDLTIIGNKPFPEILVQQKPILFEQTVFILFAERRLDYRW